MLVLRGGAGPAERHQPLRGGTIPGEQGPALEGRGVTAWGKIGSLFGVEGQGSGDGVVAKACTAACSPLLKLSAWCCTVYLQAVPMSRCTRWALATHTRRRASHLWWMARCSAVQTARSCASRCCSAPR